MGAIDALQKIIADDAIHALSGIISYNIGKY